MSWNGWVCLWSSTVFSGNTRNSVWSIVRGPIRCRDCFKFLWVVAARITSCGEMRRRLLERLEDLELPGLSDCSICWRPWSNEGNTFAEAAGVSTLTGAFNNRNKKSIERPINAVKQETKTAIYILALVVTAGFPYWQLKDWVASSVTSRLAHSQ